MNGYNSGETEEDWLILPTINMNNYVNEVLTFDLWWKYGVENTDNYLKLLYSTDYSGAGDPSTATWTEIAFTQPAISNTWASTGNIDLSTITGTTVNFAIKYRYTVGNYKSWSIDNISIVADGTAPVFTANYPAIQNVGGTSFDVAVNMDEAGTAYYMVVADNATEPTVAEVIAANQTIAVVAANTVYTANYATAISPNTSYDVYFVAQDDETTPNVQATVTKVDVTTLDQDIIAPAFVGTYPMVANITETTADFEVQLDEAGTVYYLILADGTTAPAVSEVIAANNAIAVSAATTTFTANITTLTQNTAYDVYFVAQDDEATPNVQATTTLKEFTTLEADLTAPVFIATYPAIGTVSYSSISANVQLDEAGKVFFLAYEVGVTAPTVDDIIANGVEINVVAPNTTYSGSVSGLTPETA